MIGKSYDGWTGLMAIAERPKGLAAVRLDGARLLGLPVPLHERGALHQLRRDAGELHGHRSRAGRPTNDAREYLLNGRAPNAGLLRGSTSPSSSRDSETAAFWEERNLLPPLQGRDHAAASCTQGYLETNTKPDGAFDV